MRVLNRGVTLIELMIVVVVIAILASVAIPSYRTYLLRSQRSDATTALLRIQAAQEKFFMQNMQYTANLAAAPPAGLGLSTMSDQGRYDLAVVLGPGNMTYTATATPRAGGGQTDDTKCTSFSVTQAGNPNATGSAANPRVECWR